MKRSIKSTQREKLILDAKITTTGGVPALDAEGGADMVLVDSGVGHYTLTYKRGADVFSFGRLPNIQITPRTTAMHAEVFSESVAGCVIKCFAMDGTTAKDGHVDVKVSGSTVADIH